MSGPGGRCRAADNDRKPAAFVQKLYTMIDECETELASWTQGGRMFIIKDPETFAQTKIPKSFGHNKFSSFARQLNFYGFRKVSAKPIKNEDLTEDSSNHVVFYNPCFVKGRLDLLPDIQRKTRCSKAGKSGEEEEIQDLKQKVSDLKKLIGSMQSDFEGQCALIVEQYQTEAKSLMNYLTLIESPYFQSGNTDLLGTAGLTTHYSSI
mmetsp:Transcript_27046/g.38765  ORF Transcript_27046/g.38765 Transcript_27046/m.38765 type:complete len:208 (-) Transcript_27046:46-669(-)